MEDIALEKLDGYGRMNAKKGGAGMKRFAILLALLVIAVVLVLLMFLKPPGEGDFPTVPAITEPGATEETWPTMPSDPELP